MISTEGSMEGLTEGPLECSMGRFNVLHIYIYMNNIYIYVYNIYIYIYIYIIQKIILKIIK